MMNFLYVLLILLNLFNQIFFKLIPYGIELRKNSEFLAILIKSVNLVQHPLRAKNVSLPEFRVILIVIILLLTKLIVLLLVLILTELFRILLQRLVN